uniref:Peptidase M14 domain-containing protein n=1 Tax=Chromera velia CCMP2878 TaxID=1169474 RepID=A0A0G4FDY6_9ALVE|eukprot:Cvel_16449.t1-p1 / transcript=Cvel_16449.t1 / gene=Cvel_16449 / organism=Chromera_velia_CCMP2878 / gene_product=hypothetical protein / transcript_product=hypothetical protein / location=Cvel_scaffold1268:16867-17856(-) / protein_length=330 / sequence_SO=supercontig / SO=protein_coding / is_pseudo=false
MTANGHVNGKMTAPGVHSRYHIGTPDQPWSDKERDQWRSEQTKKRDYFTDVVSPLLRFTGGDVFQYGSLDYRHFGAANYPLYAVKSSKWDRSRPLVVVTGGVHGYETSGVWGALLFVQEQFHKYTQKVNLLVLPCISPWGYETINRWTPEAVDPNRCFKPTTPGCAEAAQAMATIITHVQQSTGVLMHTDLHETTDTDNSEFVPAKAARDGLPIPDWDPIPDGFYLIGHEPRPQLEWHKTMMAAVQKVTHIADPDERGTIVGEKPVAPGILILGSVGDCGSHTSAEFCCTTEVYPDSERTTEEICNVAQCTAVVAGLDFALQHSSLLKQK